jgi:CNT family concentrative nucleoside transporter
MRTWKKTALVLGLVLPMALFVTGVATSSAQDPSPTAVESPAETPAESPAEEDAPAAEEAPSKQAAPAGGPISLSALKQSGADLGSSWGQRFQSLLGMAFLLGICVVFSNNRKKISWRLVGWGLGLQMAMGILVMKTGLGRWIFSSVNDIVAALLNYTAHGAKFLFGNLSLVNNPPVVESIHGGAPWADPGTLPQTGNLAEIGAYFAFGVLPTIIFFSSLMAVLYHAGVMQLVVKVVATVMQKTMGTSGAETLAASGNIFVGQTESPLLIRPFVKGMTESELMAVMTCGFATVAGGVMAAAGPRAHAREVRDLRRDEGRAEEGRRQPDRRRRARGGRRPAAGPECGRDAPGLPGPGRPGQRPPGLGRQPYGRRVLRPDLGGAPLGRDRRVRPDHGGRRGGRRRPGRRRGGPDRADLIELAKEAAAASGAAHTSITFSADAAVATIDDAGTLIVGLAAFDAARPYLAGLPEPQPVEDTSWESGLRGLTLEAILGFLLAPLAWLMGVPWEDAGLVGQLIGVKTILNEFVAYGDLAGMIPAGALAHPRSVIIATYALCGFANLGSIAIQIGGIGGIAPERRSDLAKLGLKAMIAGNIGCLLTATVAGLLV